MELDVGQVIRSLQRQWKILLAIPITLAILGLIVSQVLPKSYTASSQVFIPPPLTGGAPISEGASTYNTLVTSGPVLDRVILELGLDLTREELGTKVYSVILEGGQFIQIAVSDADPKLAADIANSIARNFEVQVTDLTLGEYQRNLDNLVLQSEQLQGQITVLDTRLAEIDIPENEDDTAIQGEIRLLQSDRLNVAQSKADIDAAVRELDSQLKMSAPPVVLADSALPPAQPDSPQPVLLALAGGFLGVLMATMVLVLVTILDRRFRDETQVVSGPVLGHLEAAEPSQSGLRLLAARLNVLRNGEQGTVVLVSARNSTATESIVTGLDSVGGHGSNLYSAAVGLLDDASPIEHVAASKGAVIVAETGISSLADLEEAQSLLDSINVPILGTVVVSRS